MAEIKSLKESPHTATISFPSKRLFERALKRSEKHEGFSRYVRSLITADLAKK